MNTGYLSVIVIIKYLFISGGQGLLYLKKVNFTVNTVC